MSKTFVVVLACLVAAALAETMIIADKDLLRTVTNSTGTTKTLAASPFTISSGNPLKGLKGLSLAADGQTMFALNVEENIVVKFTVGSPTVDITTVAGGKNTTEIELAEASGTSVVFTDAVDMAMGKDGDLFVLDQGSTVIRKVTPAGVVTPFAGAKLDTTQNPAVWVANEVGDGDATTAGFNQFGAIAYSSGKFLIYDNGTMREMTDEGIVTTKSGPSASPGTNGIGTNAAFDMVQSIAFSADGQTAYVSEMQIADPYAAVAGVTNSTSVIRKIDLSNFAVTTFAGNVWPADGNAADGTGTSVLFTTVGALALDSADNIFVTETCETGAVIRKITPDGTVSTHAGDKVTVGCKVPKAAFDATQTSNKNSDVGTSAVFAAPTAMVMSQALCDKFYPLGVTPDLSECSDLSGEVSQVMASGNVQITAPLTVNSLFIILAGGSVKADAPITVNGPFEVAGNGTVEINDNDIIADEVTLSEEGTYQILVSKAVPGILKSRGIARVKGAFVLAVSSAFDFAVGASVSVLEFTNFEGNFDNIFFVKLRSRSSRALLQDGASSANVACAGTSCQATGVTSSADDDDEIPFIVALIVVAALLFFAIVAAIYIASTGGSPFSNKKAAAAPAATAYGANQDEFASTESSSSSSSTYDIGFAPQFGEEYSY